MVFLLIGGKAIRAQHRKKVVNNVKDTHANRPIFIKGSRLRHSYILVQIESEENVADLGIDGIVFDPIGRAPAQAKREMSRISIAL